MRQPVTDTGAPYDVATFLEAVSQSYRAITKVDVLLNGDPYREGIAVTGGTVTMDRRAQHRGRCSVQIIEPDLIPTLHGGPLAPVGYELRVWRGVRIDGVDVWVSLGIFGIYSTSVDGTTKEVTVEGWDRSKRVSDAKLTGPYAWNAGSDLGLYIVDLLRNALTYIPEFQFYGGTHTTAAVVHETGADPWKIIQVDGAKARGHETYFDGDGVYIWRPEPDLRNAEPVCDLHEGEGGVLTELDLAFTREGAYNQWTVIGETVGDTNEWSGTVLDDDPDSLTYYFGSFGPAPAPIVVSKTVNSNEAAFAAAEALKAANLGIARSINFGLVPNPALEPGDAVSLRRLGVHVDETVLIDSLTIGLGAKDGMSGQVRAKQELL